MVKTELHTHTADDPKDRISHTAHELIDGAAGLGFGALAITLHDRWHDCTPLEDYARRRGIVLIAGVERTIAGKHVLLLNFGAASETVDSFAALAKLRRADPDGLVIAPHPFYPGPTCLGSLLDRHADLFDAVEFNAFYTARLNHSNLAALEWASRHGKPVVANTDLHRLHQLGRTYTEVEAEPNPAAICAAIKIGKVRIRTEPLTLDAAARHLSDLLFSELVTAIRRRRPFGGQSWRPGQATAGPMWDVSRDGSARMSAHR
jgi:predicted metal-dependent phosphoesterase TrpH